MPTVSEEAGEGGAPGAKRPLPASLGCSARDGGGKRHHAASDDAVPGNAVAAAEQQQQQQDEAHPFVRIPDVPMHLMHTRGIDE